MSQDHKNRSRRSKWLKTAAKAWPWVAGFGAVLAIWTWVVPADWVKPQSLWTTPKPRIATADVVRRWPAFGSDGVENDSALIQLRGDALQPNLPERGCRLMVLWRLVDTKGSRWHVGYESLTRIVPASLPMSVLTSGPWELSLTVNCPSDFRGEIELIPLVLSRDSIDDIAQRAARQSGLSTLPDATATGNGFSAVTSGVTNGEPASPYRQVAQLSANVPISRFRAVLGQESISAPTRRGHRYMFITDSYCVEAVTDMSGRVAVYAVTTLDSAFQPTFRYWAFDHWKSVTLGKTRFSDSDLSPDACYAYTYANRYLYYEMLYLAGPGDYQTVFLADNYMGKPGYPEQPELGMVSFGLVKKGSAKKLREFRRSATPNTYGFFAPVYGNSKYNRDLNELLSRSDAGPVWIGPTAWDSGSIEGDGTPASSPSASD